MSNYYHFFFFFFGLKEILINYAAKMAKLAATCLQKLSPFSSAYTKAEISSDGGKSKITRQFITKITLKFR